MNDRSHSTLARRFVSQLAELSCKGNVDSSGGADGGGGGCGTKLAEAAVEDGQVLEWLEPPPPYLRGVAAPSPPPRGAFGGAVDEFRSVDHVSSEHDFEIVGSTNLPHDAPRAPTSTDDGAWLYMALLHIFVLTTLACMPPHPPNHHVATAHTD